MLPETYPVHTPRPPVGRVEGEGSVERSCRDHRGSEGQGAGGEPQRADTVLQDTGRHDRETVTEGSQRATR